MPITTKTITWVIIFFMSFLGAMMFPPVTNAAPAESSQILVRIKDGQDRKKAEAALQNAGGRLKQTIPGIDVLVITVPARQQQKILENLSRNPVFEYAEADDLGHASSNDAFFGNQWGLDNTGQTIKDQAGVTDADIDAPEAWATTTGQGVRVAVLDSGVDQDHEDISSKLVAQQNFTGSGTIDDKYGHGTHVAGIIAAATDNSVGVAGVCPGCTIMNGKVLNDNGGGYVSWVSNGITWAADNQAKVINMSLGFDRPSKTLERAVNYAWNKGVVIVASAGNDNNTSKEYPGAYANVIAVAATDNRDQKASFSTYGTWVDIAAPGANIYSTFPNHPFVIQNIYGRSMNYDFANGTSMAAPMVAGAAALVSTLPEYNTSATSIRNRLETTANKIPGTGTYWTAGRLNAAQAVAR